MVLSALDWIILAILGFSVIVGFFVGFIRSILSVLVWIGAVVASMYIGPSLASFFSSVSDSPDIRLWLSYGVVFVVTALIGWVVKMIAGMILSMARPSFLNNMLGAAFGLIRGCLLIVILMWFILLSGTNQTAFYQNSRLAPFFAGMTGAIVSMFPGVSANLQSTLNSLRSGQAFGSSSLGGMGGGSSSGGGGYSIGGTDIGGAVSQAKGLVSQAVSAVQTNLGGLNH